MDMTVEELLAPRYKVIADYPGNLWDVGTLLPSEYHAIKELSPNMIAFYDKYPHLFRKLEWWEERKPEDMPEYLKTIHHDGRIYKAIEHNIKASNGLGFINENGLRKSYCNYLPTTLEDYTHYTKSNKGGMR